MDKKTIKRELWKDKYIALPDDAVERYKKAGGVVITMGMGEHKGEVMTLTAEQLESRKLFSPPSKFDQKWKKNYKLWNYLWIPDEGTIKEKPKDPNFCYCTPTSPRPLNYEPSLSKHLLKAECSRCKKPHLKQVENVL